jgi:hypothetical protein
MGENYIQNMSFNCDKKGDNLFIYETSKLEQNDSDNLNMNDSGTAKIVFCF